MNSFNCLVLIIISLTAFTSEPVDGLECWQCKGTINDGCNDPFLGRLFDKKKCSDNEKVCLKIKQNANDATAIIRKCGVLEPHIPNTAESMVCRDVSNQGLPTIEECYCNTDGCNGSSQLTILTSLTAFLPIVIYTFLSA